jgi:hypothetical protein
MPKNQRKKADETLLLTLACGASVDAAARQCNLSKRTVYRRLENPSFRRQMLALRADMVERTAGTLTAAGAESVRTLIVLQQPAIAAAVRLGAARAVLELGVKLREAAELEGRIAALEQQLLPAG